MNIQDILDFLRDNRQFKYIYDFGDCWEHRITIGKTQKALWRQALPVSCIRLSDVPIEDIGGSWGYESFLHALNNPGSEYPEHLAGLIESFPDWDPHDAQIEKPRENLSEFAS